jgi:hypothetical protein
VTTPTPKNDKIEATDWGSPQTGDQDWVPYKQQWLGCDQACSVSNGLQFGECPVMVSFRPESAVEPECFLHWVEYWLIQTVIRQHFLASTTMDAIELLAMDAMKSSWHH